MSIRTLDNITINKIAAGEVIENAASVVKELVENSIDAGAHNISIEVNGGGFDYIKITDDGDGIEKDEIEIAFKEHATSKLTRIEDLEDISSFGFRGEALPSIASVSDVELITKSKTNDESFGYRYRIEERKTFDLETIASNYGTTILVKNLFKNVPIRKKFLKDSAKENSYIVDLVMKFALSNPEISFNLTIDGRQKFVSKGNGDIKSILYTIYGKEVYDNLIDADGDYGDISIKGVVAKPIISKGTKQDEIYFVNKRYVKNKIISSAIENAYEAYLMQHRFPVAVLNITISGKSIDVNVHPRKLEVRFSNDDRVYFAVYDSVAKALKESDLVHEEKLSYEEIETNESEKKTETYDELPTLKDLLHYKSDSGIKYDNFYKNIDKIESAFKKEQKLEEKPFITKTLTEDHRYLGQIFNTYILVEFEDKLYIIDQHAAHEKINFEKLMKRFREGDIDSQKIFPSIILKLTPVEYAAVEKNIEAFEKIGYEIELFGDRDIKVDAVPSNIFNIGSSELLKDMIASFVDEKNKEEYDTVVEKIASISCKKSIKANHILSEIEVKELLRELFKLDNPYNCPHGRPTIISLSKLEFEKRFGRVV
ncbi:MAG: DNA mismatch repair endonuclease MutL [Lachnospiraceae bacterium]|nr:DNA mismatch repair endonuclease MutL [Lachnospiraceae bacterium]